MGNRLEQEHEFEFFSSLIPSYCPVFLRITFQSFYVIPDSKTSQIKNSIISTDHRLGDKSRLRRCCLTLTAVIGPEGALSKFETNLVL